VLPLSGRSFVPPCVQAGNRWECGAALHHTDDSIISLCSGTKPVDLEPSVAVTVLCSGRWVPST